MVTPPKDLVDRGRVLAYELVYSDSGNALPPLRWTRHALRFFNDLCGQPLCSADKLARRQADLAAAEKAIRDEGISRAASPRREAAPVVLYVTDQDYRSRKKLEDILKGRDIPYAVNDVTDDEASRSWALTQAQKAEFPLVFVAGEPLGGLDELMELDVRGELTKKVFG